MPRGHHAVTERPARCPTHPGELLREILADGLKLSVAAAARQLGVSRMTLHRLLRGKQAVTPEMALRLGKLCGNGPSSGCGCRWRATSGASSASSAPTSLASRPTARRDPSDEPAFG
ncbi:MAG: higA [Geminicoccaceae bacterium]|jgi:addiction module HigA family antidote|nr:higA [Geminicoccaceae bacterium]